MPWVLFFPKQVHLGLFWVFFDDGSGLHQGFCLCRMAEIKWRERDSKSVRDASLDDGNVRDTLARCGLLKFMRIPLMRSFSLLMQKLIGFWDVDEEVFLFQCQCIEITLEEHLVHLERLDE